MSEKSTAVKDYSPFFTELGKRRTLYPSNNLIRQLTNDFISNGCKGTFLAGGMPNSETFPIDEISVTYKDGAKKRLVGHELSTALQYGSSHGHPALIKKWKELQTKCHSPKYENWDVQVTTGALDACNMILELLVQEGQPLMLQSPAFPGFLSAILPMNYNYISIEMDDDGLLPQKIITIFEERIKNRDSLPRILYLNPTGANPTGCVYGDKRKLEIYKLAQKYDFLILEDDPYYFLHFLDQNPMSFLSLDTDGRVIRVDSFSKIISAGLRVGIVTAPKQIIEMLTLHQSTSILHTSSLCQVLIYEFLKSRSHEDLMNHFKVIQKFYLSKRDLVLAVLDKYFTGIAEWTVPKGGMFVWLKLNVVEDVYDLAINKCPQMGCYIMPGHSFSIDGSTYRQYIRICYSQAEFEKVDKSLREIARLAKLGS